MIIDKKYQTLINLVVLVILGLLSYQIFRALNDDGPGQKFLGVKEEKKVSRHYIHKSVRRHNPFVSWQDRNLEEGSANLVTSVVVNYRAFDTLGEILVLFAAVAGVGLLLIPRRKRPFSEASSIMRTAIPWLAVLAIMTGLYIIAHGHLTPGGGFPGGALIASGFIFIALITKKFIKKTTVLILESLSGLGILFVAFWGTISQGQFFANFLSQGRLGDLFSAGTVLLLYALIGFKVASELVAVGYYFMAEQKERGDDI